jgi:plasmid stability protein
MNKHVQVRSLPEPVHRQLKGRAAAEGLSISEYVKRLIEREMKKPTWDEMVKRMRELEPVRLPVSTAELIREERDSR